MEFSPTEIGQSVLGLGLALKGMAGLFAQKKVVPAAPCGFTQDMHDKVNKILTILETRK